MTRRAEEPSNIAADPTRSAWVAANAGAGKTYTLANRVTRLLLSGTPPERILCLTYTKAAAAEMQARLFKQLGEWSMLPGRELEAKIVAIGADLGGPEEMKRARRLFAQALETPGGIRILTIHAFCQSVLSRFPLEAGVPASFDVLDDQTVRDLMGQARARVLEHAQGGTDEAKALALLITEVSEQTLASILDAALGSDRRKLERFLDSIGGGNFAEAIRRAHGADPARSADDMMTTFCSGLDRAQLQAIAAWLESGTKTDKERAEDLRLALGRTPGRTMYEMFRALFLTQDKGAPRKDIATAGISKQRPDLSAAYGAIRDEFVIVEEQRRAAHAAALTIACITLASAVRAEYGRLKRTRGALDYDDLIVRTQLLLEQSDAAAWVLYKLDGGIEHVLIDEAQDTSPEQWSIVRALTAEFFAGDGTERLRDRKPVTRTIFAVGDEKQSIFSFQGADPAQFDKNRHFFRDAAANAAHEFLEQPLIQSRRSVPQVLKFVDAVFQPESARAGLTSDAAAIQHDAHRAEAAGRVELWPSTPVADKTQPDPYLLPVDVLAADSPVVLLARRIADQIRRWIGRVRLPGHDQPVKAGDIMILLPRREPFGNAIIRELKQRGVAVAGADRIVLTEQIAVMDLVALGRFALQSEDDYTLAVLLRSPFCDVSEKELFELAHPRGEKQTLWQALQEHKNDRPSYAAALAFLTEMRDMADFTPPYEFYAHALVGRGMRLRLLRRLGQEANDAIDEFLSLTFAYESANTPSLEGFLHWIERGGAEVKRDMERGRDEVRVMTVHGAKGLEADIVILPDTTTEPDLQPARGSLLYTDTGVLYPIARAHAPRAVEDAKAIAKAKMMEEHRRLLYVALTRARDKLIVCGFENRRGVQKQSWYALAQQAANELGMEIDGDEGVHIIGPGHEILLAPKAQQLALSLPPRKPWIDRPAPRDVPAPRLIRPFDAAGMEEPAVFAPFGDNRRFARGLLVHTLLAHLPEIAPAERQSVALQFLRRQNIEETAALALARETLRVLDDPKFAPAFAPSSRAEIAIVADLPELGANARVNGRIDRLAVSDDNVLIVDFKTNRPPPAREEDVAPLYATQMALYRAAAQKIYPGKRIACGLVWTDGPTLMELSNEFLDRELVRIRARLDPQR